MLIVGLAGGTVSNLVSRHLGRLVPDLAIVGVEIDPQVLEVADRHLALDRGFLETAVADGRVWLRASQRRFDLILLDAYQQPSIPAHLATREFFEDVRGHLAPGGLAVLNVFAPAGRSELLDGLIATWGSVFPELERFDGPVADGFASRLLMAGPALPLDFGRVMARDSTAPASRLGAASGEHAPGAAAARGGVLDGRPLSGGAHHGSPLPGDAPGAAQSPELRCELSSSYELWSMSLALRLILTPFLSCDCNAPGHRSSPGLRSPIDTVACSLRPSC